MPRSAAPAADASLPPSGVLPVHALAARDGEWLVVRVRLAICPLLLVVPAGKVLLLPYEPAFAAGLAITLGATAVALAEWWWLRTRRFRPAFGFVTSVLDVSFVTASLLIFMLTSSPLAGLNSTATFEVYYLALAATSLRYDRRTSLGVGLVALGQYSGLLAFGHLRWDLGALRGGPDGAYDPADQVTRLILLGATVLLTDAIIVRARRLLDDALYDPLTGVFNRASLARQLSLELDRARRHGHELVVAIVDADHFKAVNDNYGHATGDRTLALIASALRKGLRRHDTVVRYGGEEFVLIMPCTSAENACRRIDGFRASMRSRTAGVASWMGRSPGVTVSVGVAAYPADGADEQRLLAAADRRLLRAKRQGRDRVVGPSASGVTPPSGLAVSVPAAAVVSRT